MTTTALRNGDAFHAEEHCRLFRWTGQDGGVRPEQRISNVYKMYRSSRVHPTTRSAHQTVCINDPGLGTDGAQADLPE